MKKTLLAMTIPAVLLAGSAVASFDFYNEGRVRVWTEGDFIVTATEQFDKSNNVEIQLNTAKLGFGVEVAINSCLSAFAYTRFRLEQDGYDNQDNGGAGSAQTDQAYVGLKCSQWGAISFGRMYLISDDMSISNAHDLDGGIRAKDGGGLELVNTHSDQAVKYEYGSLGDQGLYFGASYGSPTNSATGSAEKYGTTSYDVAIGYRQDWFELRAFYAARRDVDMSYSNGNVDYNTSTDASIDYPGTTGHGNGKIDSWDLEALFYVENWNFGLSYGQTRYKSGANSDNFYGRVNRGTTWDAQEAQVDVISGIVSYQINSQWKIGGGVNYAMWKIDRNDASYYDSTVVTDNQFKENATNAYVYVDYQMHKNVKLFGEVGYLSTTSATLNNFNSAGLYNRDVADNATYAKDGIFYDDKYRNYAFEVGLEVTF